MSETDIAIHKGLDGVIVDETTVSMVNSETNSLTYRGYPVQQLAEHCSFEEVAYLIWYGELPSADELANFASAEKARRRLPEGLESMLDDLPTRAHPMDLLRTAVSWLGTIDLSNMDRSPDANLERSVDLLAKIPTIVAHIQRRRRGEAPIPPNDDLGFSENFLTMCFGEVPDDATRRCFEISLVLYAEHGFNASTFTARVVTSTLSDLYSSVTAAIGALKGPLHGGANEAVIHMFDEIGEPDRAVEWLHDAFARRALIMGFGHRVYKHGDSRVPMMKQAFFELAEARGDDRLRSLYSNLESAMVSEKGIYPNLDFPSGPAYSLIGFDTELFTPLFVLARITGWTAHIIEQLQANSLIRPLSCYVGRDERSLESRLGSLD